MNRRQWLLVINHQQYLLFWKRKEYVDELAGHHLTEVKQLTIYSNDKVAVWTIFINIVIFTINVFDVFEESAVSTSESFSSFWRFNCVYNFSSLLSCYTSAFSVVTAGASVVTPASLFEQLPPLHQEVVAVVAASAVAFSVQAVVTSCFDGIYFSRLNTSFFCIWYRLLTSGCFW